MIVRTIHIAATALALFATACVGDVAEDGDYGDEWSGESQDELIANQPSTPWKTRRDCVDGMYDIYDACKNSEEACKTHGCADPPTPGKCEDDLKKNIDYCKDQFPALVDDDSNNVGDLSFGGLKNP